MKTFKQFIEDVSDTEFLRLWKARPIFTHKTGLPITQALRQHHQESFAYFKKNFGGDKVWTPELYNKYNIAIVDSKTISYKGKKFRLSTFMDAGDFVRHVFDSSKK